MSSRNSVVLNKGPFTADKMELPCAEYWRRRLICSGCNLPLKLPVYYCQNASPHPVCSDCNTCLAKTLGFCQSRVGTVRSATLENLVRLAKFSCQYQCKEKGPYFSLDYRKHVQVCHLRPIECCLCNGRVEFANYFQHLTELHFVQSQLQERMLLGGNFSFDFKLGQARVEYAQLEDQTFLFRYDNGKFWIEILSPDEEADVDYFVLVSGLRAVPIGVKLKLIKCRDGQLMLGGANNNTTGEFYLNTHYIIPAEDDLIYVSIVPENDNFSISSLNESEEECEVDADSREIARYVQNYVNDSETNALIMEKRQSLGNVLEVSRRNGSVSDFSDAESSEATTSTNSIVSNTDDIFNISAVFATNEVVAFSHLSLDRRKSRNEIHCEHILQEILTTEQGYVRDLNDILAGYGSATVAQDYALAYILPDQLKKYSKKYKDGDGTTVEGLNYNRAIFGNLEDIHLFHYRNFLPRISDSWSSVMMIAHSFMDYCDQISILYRHYCHLLPSCTKLLKDIGEDHPWLIACQQRINHRLDLGSYLLRPVQRITKYQLFFKDLIKHCEDNEEFEVLEKAHTGIINMLQGVNTSMLQMNIVNYDNLYDEGPLILEAPFRVWTESDKLRISGHPRICFLYAKSILVCKRDPDPGKSVLHFKTRVNLDAIGMTETMPGNNPNRFELWTPGKEKQRYLFEAESKEVKDAWIGNIKKSLLQQLEDARQAKCREAGLPAPPSAIDALSSF